MQTFLRIIVTATGLGSNKVYEAILSYKQSPDISMTINLQFNCGMRLKETEVNRNMIHICTVVLLNTNTSILDLVVGAIHEK